METLALRQNTKKLNSIARIMKTVGHPSRLMILELLLENGPLPVKDIYEAINISQSNASQHLKALEDIDILQSERDGKNICYSIRNPQVARLLHCVNACSEC